MKLPKIAIFISLIGLTLTACSDEEEATNNVVNDVTFYLENESERVAMNKRCENNPGLLDSDPNCVNAEEAKRKKKSEEFLKSLEAQ